MPGYGKLQYIRAATITLMTDAAAKTGTSIFQ